MSSEFRPCSRILLLVFFLCTSSAQGQGRGANWQQAQRYRSASLRHFSYSSSLRAHWIGQSESFWYRFKTSAGTRYWIVDPEARTKRELFDQDHLAALLSEKLRVPLEGKNLGLSRESLDDQGEEFRFRCQGKDWVFHRRLRTLRSRRKAEPKTKQGGEFGGRALSIEGWGRKLSRFFDKNPKPKPRVGLSPDGKVWVYTEGFNLFVVTAPKKSPKAKAGAKPRVASSRPGSRPTTSKPLKSKRKRWSRGWRFSKTRARQLTQDGAEKYLFGRNRESKKQGLKVSWSPDSQAFFTTRTDSRGILELFLVDSLGQPRPKLKTYAYAMPGEDKIRHSELFVYSRKSGKLKRVKAKWKDESYFDTRWLKNGELRVVRRDRLRRNIQYGRVDPESGEFHPLLEEGFRSAYYELQRPRYLESSKRFLWWSERSGWGHFYLYDLAGKLLSRVTSGAYRASRIVDVDEAKGLLWFIGNGREPGENPYQEHLYRVRLDGSDLRLLTEGDAFHRVQLSKSRRFLVDVGSRVDREPRAVVRDAHGAKIMDLETCDLEILKAMGWKMPETFTVKAADGVTDLYGNLWKPFDFDPKKRYPIIVSAYPGPQQEGVSRSFSATSSRQELAQLGFIVVQVGHRGGSPKRSKAYASYGYFNLRDYGLADKKAALEELAARHPWIDIERVGIYGHSGGGFMTAAALLRKPYNEFFKVGVSSSGNHDNNIYNHSWSERYHGLKKKGKTGFEIHVPTNTELAANLRGHLLLVHGEIDNNVHPAGTMRLVDSLIKAGKRFDLLIIPGARHGYGKAGDYFRQRMYEYFARHLLGDRLDGADIRLKTPSREGAEGS